MLITFLPGVSAIYVIQASKLPAWIRELSLTGLKPLLMLDFMQLDLGPNATAYEETETAAEGTAAKSSLSFISSELPFPVSEPLAFLIIAADGQQYIIGAKEPPYPKIKVRKDLSTPREGNASIAYTVEWPERLIPCKSHILSF